MKSARYALIDTTMTAMAASAWYQNVAHAESTWPWLVFPPAILIIVVKAVKILRHKIPHSVNFRRRGILTFQSKIIGMDVTAAFSISCNLKSEDEAYETHPS